MQSMHEPFVVNNLTHFHFSLQNFVLNIVETQLIDDISNQDGSLTSIGSQIRILNIFFLGVFVIELLINIVANWWRRFLKSPWNLLDVAMVTSGVLSTVSLQLVVLRLLRIARVLRIFGKVRALREIITALASSLIPMASAFFILVIMMCMCECCD
jgi:voltage-gated sodium channel